MGGGVHGSDDEDPYAEIRGDVADSSSDETSEVRDIQRCGSPEAVPLAADASECEPGGLEDEEPDLELGVAVGQPAARHLRVS